MSFFDFISQVPKFIDGLQEIDTLNQGAILDLQGSNLEAQGLRIAGDSHAAISRYNREVEKNNFDKQLDQTIRNQASFLNTQRAQVSGTGADIASGSFLQVMNDTMGIFERSILQSKSSNKQKLQAMKFNAEISEVAFNNQAVAVEQKARTQQFINQRETEKTKSSFFQNLGSSLFDLIPLPGN